LHAGDLCVTIPNNDNNSIEKTVDACAMCIKEPAHSNANNEDDNEEVNKAENSNKLLKLRQIKSVQY